MPKSIVVYRSISGYTRRYAQWIAEELGADLFDSRQVDPGKLPQYDLVVFGGSLHAVGINGAKIIKANLSLLAGKKVVVFAVGASPPRPEIPDEVKTRNFTIEQQKSISAFFYLRGGFNYNKLNFTNKVLMSLMKVKLRLKRKRTPDEIGMLAAYAKPMDFAKKENIKPLINYAQSIAD
jgi:menaquinone-dependent protoporphyrinogen IX oxidase